MPTPLKNNLPGLPEGVVAVRFDIAGPNDFEMYGDAIQKGPRAGSHSQIIVQPAPGYTFLWDIAKGCYRCVKMLPTKKRITAVFEVLNSLEHESLKALLGHPNLVSVKEQDMRKRFLGRLPKKQDPRTLKLGKYMLESLPPPPASKDWSAIQNLGPMMNDSIGDCAVAGYAHQVQCWNQFAGHPFVPPDEDVLTAYEAISGYNPNDPNTDNGCVMIDALNYWRADGIAGHKIAAYTELDSTKPIEMKQSISLFGGAYLGFAMPNSAQNQTVWDIDNSDPDAALPGSWGGHCVQACAYDADGITVISWGEKVKVTWAFVAKYLEEAYGLLSSDFLSGAGKTPTGFDLPTLQGDLQKVTA